MLCTLAYSNIRKLSPSMKTGWWHYSYVPVIYLHIPARHMTVYDGICQDIMLSGFQMKCSLDKWLDRQLNASASRVRSRNLIRYLFAVSGYRARFFCRFRRLWTAKAPLFCQLFSETQSLASRPVCQTSISALFCLQVYHLQCTCQM